MSNRALIAQIFLLIGYLFGRYEERLSSLSWGLVFLLASTYIGMAIFSQVLWPEKGLDVHLNQYVNLPYYLCLIYLGCFTVFTVARKLLINNPILTAIGKNTLLIYGFHGYVFKLLEIFTDRFLDDFPGTWFGVIIQAGFSISVCLLVAFFVNRYIPEAVGHQRKKKTVE